MTIRSISSAVLKISALMAVITAQGFAQSSLILQGLVKD
jgi:hypothetical protein